MLDVKISRRRFVQTAFAAGTSLALTPACSLIRAGAGAGAGPPDRPQDSRFLSIDGLFNARDIGGHAAGTQIVLTGRVFRSASLHRVTDLGLRQLGDLHLGSVVDFRRTAEIGSRVDRLPPGVTAVSTPVSATVAAGPPTGGLTEPDSGTRTEFRAYVGRPESRQSFGAALRALAGASDRPLLWHCNSGTYRTGWATAVLLTALGVPKDAVYQDFLLSNVAFGATFAFTEYLDAAFDEVTTTFGSFDAYLDRGLGVDQDAQARLRRALLGAP
jgi:protein-tyrosine phosphatase